MGLRAYFERLASTAEDPPELFEHFEERDHDGLTYHVLTDERHGVERGTVVVPEADAVVRGYPSVPRLLVLESGVPAVFGDERVAIEEKLDGFNVRIADVGEPLAFTRSGYVCPFSTHLARERLPLESFFADRPETVLCTELIGPETPYTATDYEGVDSAAVRVFGLRDRETGDPLPVEERRAVCESYDLPQSRSFGVHDPGAAVEAARDAVLELDVAGREGIVLKAADGEPRAKYTTERQHHDELAYAFGLPFDYGRDFVFSRVVREGFQAVEFDEDDERLRERARELGEAILLPMVETIRDVEAGAPVGQRQTVRGDPEAIEGLLDHLGDQGLTVEVERDDREGGERVVEFLKVSESTRDRIEYYLEGGTVDE